jgi:hypothetical protein
MLDPEDVRRFAEATSRVERLQEVIAGGGGSQVAQSTVTVQAGGFALWVATTCCAVMLATNLCLLFMFAGHDRKIERLEDYLQAIYAQAPHLKPKDSP